MTGGFGMGSRCYSRHSPSNDLNHKLILYSLKMKEIFSILLGFLPWIVFGVVSGPSLWRLNAAIIVALALVLVMGYKQLAKGFILTWGSLLFFGVNLVMVVLCRNLWVIKNLDILAKGTLAAIAWLSIFMGKPFVLQYARETAPPGAAGIPGLLPDLPDPRGDLGGDISHSHRDERGENLWLVGRRDGLSGGVLGLDRVRPMAQPLVSSICAQ